jgi:hypothetical protein
MEIGGIPVFYIVPLMVFGPILFTILWNFGLKNLFMVPEEVKESRRRAKEEAAEKAAVTKKRRPAEKLTTTTSCARCSVSSWIGQGVTYLAFAAVIGYLSNAPAYEYLAKDHGVVKLAFSHPGQRIGKCPELEELTPEQRKKLPPGTRVRPNCPRERVPVYVEIEIDGKKVFGGASKPAGLSKDGVSRFYERFTLPAGQHSFVLRMRDSTRPEGFDYEDAREATLAPGQNLVILFDKKTGGFQFR